MIKITPENDGVTLRVSDEKHLGDIKYTHGRDIPWRATKGNTIQYFKEQHEALEYLIEDAK